jgi:hypothetical protein
LAFVGGGDELELRCARDVEPDDGFWNLKNFFQQHGIDS